MIGWVLCLAWAFLVVTPLWWWTLGRSRFLPSWRRLRALRTSRRLWRESRRSGRL